MIGESISRVDALGKVTGEALFPGDIDMPNQAHMKILFAGRPHAIIHRIDTSAAEALPGVLGVFTAKDVPVNEYGLILDDQPVLCGPGSSKPHADRVRFIGDQVAVVVAESEEIADQAAELIEIEFEDLPITTDPEQAMQPGASLIHPERESNIFQHNRIQKGDVEAGFAESAVVIESEYRTPASRACLSSTRGGLGLHR